MSICKNLKCDNETHDLDGECRPCKWAKKHNLIPKNEPNKRVEVDMSKKDSDLMKAIFVKSIEEIEGVLNENRPITDITKVAGATISNYAKIKQTECHEAGLEVARKKLKMID